jgi:hypothetical protein
VCFVAAGVIVAWAYRPRDFDWPPGPRGLADNYLDTAERDTRAVVLETMLAAYDANNRVIEEKVKAFNLAFGFSAGAALLLGVTIISDIVCHTSGPGGVGIYGPGC